VGACGASRRGGQSIGGFRASAIHAALRLLFWQHVAATRGTTTGLKTATHLGAAWIFRAGAAASHILNFPSCTCTEFWEGPFSAWQQCSRQPLFAKRLAVAAPEKCGGEGRFGQKICRCRGEQERGDKHSSRLRSHWRC